MVKMPKTNISRPSTSFTSRGVSRQSRAQSIAASIPRPRTATGISTVNDQDIICAVIESRGISPTVGIAFLNLDAAEVTLCQICDNQTYVRTIQKLSVYGPGIILVPNYSNNASSTLHDCIEQTLPECRLMAIDRRYFSEQNGADYLKAFSFADDHEAIVAPLRACYFPVCCFGAVMQYVQNTLSIKFPAHSLRISYAPPEGAVTIDVSTLIALELVQNIENSKSKICLFGLLNYTLTPMGARFLKTNILQPSTDIAKIESRFDAVTELSNKQDVLFTLRKYLKDFVDAEKILTDIITIPDKPSQWYREQALNRVLQLKRFMITVPPIFNSLNGASSELLGRIQEHCSPQLIEPVSQLIQAVVSEDVGIAKQPLEVRNQRVYGIKSGVDGLVDVARQAYREATDDLYDHVKQLAEEYQLPLELKYESNRSFYIRLSEVELIDRELPEIFVNKVKKKKWIECQTLYILKNNQKIRDCEVEIIQLCEKTVQELTEQIILHMAPLYRCCESIALLDMLVSFAHLASISDYIRPELSGRTTLALKAARHPIKERHGAGTFIANDVFSTPNSRFQLLTGANMSGKSTYLGTVALVSIMAQIGSFVPAMHATLPVFSRVCARITHGDSMAEQASTFALEMREMAGILRSADAKSLIIVDELGRGTSTRDGLAICIAISEALIESEARVWFATHFHPLVTILAPRPGVLALHMASTLSVNAAQQQQLTMHYRLGQGLSRVAHYGIALAKVFNLPKELLDEAEKVAKELVARDGDGGQAEEREKLRRRKVVLGVYEALKMARESSLEGEALRGWLINLQKEFVRRMDGADRVEEIEDPVEADGNDEIKEQNDSQVS